MVEQIEHTQDNSNVRSSGSGVELAFTVEGRYIHRTPVEVGGQLYDGRWREVKYQQSTTGIARCPPSHRHTAEHGLLGYAAAEALRWSLLATVEASDDVVVDYFETRIIAHRISYSHTIETTGALAAVIGIGQSGQLNSIM